MAPRPFLATQRSAQAAFFRRKVPEAAVLAQSPWRLAEAQRHHNLVPGLIDPVTGYFLDKGIVWDRQADHGLSSQVCCLNFLAPLAQRPEFLAEIVGIALDIRAPTMVPVETGPDGRDWYVGFEWTGQADYLGDWPKTGRAPTRGANATSADAIFCYERDGRRETLLVDWKYAETYGAPVKDRSRVQGDTPGSSGANTARRRRIAELMNAPAGPIRADAGLDVADFLWEPFYQLLRQQILAHEMERAREGGAEVVRVLQISPGGNTVLRKVTSPALRIHGNDAFAVFRSLLVQPDRFIARKTEDVFGAMVMGDHVDPEVLAWASYLRTRYGFINSGKSGPRILRAAND